MHLSADAIVPKMLSGDVIGRGKLVLKYNFLTP